MAKITTLIIILILLVGSIFRLDVTSNGEFLFNMDNARDMVDVREMVVLRKLRLIGPTSAIEGLFNGPAWYYLLAAPFVLTSGDPYGSIMMEIILWAVGGFFLLKIVASWKKFLIFPIGLLWIASDYISLTTRYAFNPNPVTHLTPLFIYLLYKYLETSRFIYIAATFFLGGLFFNFEMNAGIFMPLIIFFSIFFSRSSLLKTKSFWISSVAFIITIIPQLLFDLRHNFIMTNSVIYYLSNGARQTFDPILRFQAISSSFFSVFSATLMNHRIFGMVFLFIFIPIFVKTIKGKQKDIIGLICLLYIFIPFILYLFLPVSVNSWHLGGVAAASIVLIGFLLNELWNLNFRGKLISILLVIFILVYAFSNIFNFLLKERFQENMDPSLYRNEISAIDYVYKVANGKNFKVYTYLPSVYDYPYQYLFWWYGQKKYGYIPGEYVYSPNKPRYIPSQDKFQGRKDNLSNLVFIIKEPDRIKMRQAWEGDFKDMEFVSKEMVGPIEVEVRKELRIKN